MRVFVTGAAGFVGFHFSKILLDEGHEVYGYDAVTPYYDPSLKIARLRLLETYPRFHFVRGDLEDAPLLEQSLQQSSADYVVHLAAQAGVRYSIENPGAYVSSNIVGTFNLLEACRRFPVEHFMFASTSSVYGGNEVMPFSETHGSHLPLSLYAATKKSGEAMTHSYSHLFGIATTCFRFFTVYGPWGRPDMALFKFVSRIRRGDAIEVYGDGKMSRDYTYVADLVKSMRLLLDCRPSVGDSVGPSDSLSPVAPWRTVNIAGGGSVALLDFVTTIESELGIPANKKMLPMQAGDVTDTRADPGLLKLLTGYTPDTPISVGVREFVEWYKEYSDEHTE